MVGLLLCVQSNRSLAGDCIDYRGFLHREGGIELPGNAKSIAIQGDYAYIAALFAGLEVVDVTSPESPVLVARVGFDFPEEAADVVIWNHFAYVASYYGGLKIFDTSDPVHPTLLSSTPTIDGALGVDVNGAFAYVADRDGGLIVIDVADPKAPVIVGSVDTPDAALDVKVTGSRAYVADRDAGLVIVDVSNPAAPVVLGAVATPSWAVDVAVDGSFAYVCAQDAGLQIVDVTDPINPSIIASVPGIDAEGVSVSGGLAYLANWVNLVIIDVSEPAIPSVLSAINPRGQSIGSVAVLPWIYVASGHYGLQIVDAANLLLAPIFSEVETPGSAVDVEIEDGVAYVADGPSGLTVANVTSPEFPEILGNLRTPSYVVHADVAADIACVGSLDTLFVVDVSGPKSTPVLRATFNNPGPIYGMEVDGSHVFLAAADSGLQVIDVTDPGDPRLIARVQTTGDAEEVVVDGNLAYVIIDSPRGVYIFDISDPTLPALVGRIALNVGLSPIYVEWPHVYVVDGALGLCIADVSVPSEPVVVGSVTLPPGPRMHVSVAGGIAYVANGGLGMIIVDVTAPGSPFVVTEAARAVGSMAITDEALFTAFGPLRALPLQCQPAMAIDVSQDEWASAPVTQLLKGWPNPARGDVTIAFHLADQDRVRLNVYDVAGRLIRRLADQSLTPGTHTVRWDGRDERGLVMPSGVYAYQLQTASFRQSRTLVVVR